MSAPRRSYVHRMKSGDERPYLQVKIFNPDGTARDVTDDICTFTMRADDGTIVVNEAAMTDVIASEGLIEYRWQTGETATPGNYRGEIKINGVDTYPKETWITIIIEEALS